MKTTIVEKYTDGKMTERTITYDDGVTHTKDMTPDEFYQGSEWWKKLTVSNVVTTAGKTTRV